MLLEFVGSDRPISGTNRYDGNLSRERNDDREDDRDRLGATA